jgi:hypothetical protein
MCRKVPEENCACVGSRSRGFDAAAVFNSQINVRHRPAVAVSPRCLLLRESWAAHQLTNRHPRNVQGGGRVELPRLPGNATKDRHRHDSTDLTTPRPRTRARLCVVGRDSRQLAGSFSAAPRVCKSRSSWAWLCLLLRNSPTQSRHERAKLLRFKVSSTTRESQVMRIVQARKSSRQENF